MNDSPEHAMRSPPQIGMSFDSEATFTTEGIREFARLVGDSNPLHHDPALAGASRFGGLIASGSHTVSVMMGAAAALTSERWENVGLGFTVRLRRPVMAGETVAIHWRIVSVEHSAKLKGLVVGFEGTVRKLNGDIAVSGVCESLILDGGYAEGDPSASGKNVSGFPIKKHNP